MKDILTSRFSGELIIKSSDLSKLLLFRDGDLVFAESDIFDERIGVLLYLLGKIAEPQYEYIRNLGMHPDSEIGKILVENHFISADDLFYAELFQWKRIAINAFTIDKGKWVLREKKPEIFLKPRHRIQLPPVIVEGARKMENISFFIKKVQFLGVKTTGIPLPIKQLMTAEEIALYRRIQDCGNRSNREIISKLNLEPEFYWKKLVLFILLNIVDFLKYRIDYDIGEDICRLIQFQKKMKRKMWNNHEILGVPRSATRAEIKVAFLKLSRLFHPDRFGSAAAPEIKNIARFVHAEITKVYQALKKELKRAVHQKGMNEPEETSEFAELGFQPDFSDEYRIDLGEEMKEDRADVPGGKKADFLVDFSDELRKELEAVEKVNGFVFEEEGEKEQESKKIKPDGLAAAKKRITESVELGQMDAEGPRAQLPIQEKTPFEMAEQLYKEEKYQEAAGILKSMIKTESKRGEYHHLLGLCQTHLEFFQDEAERNLRKAIELNPWNSDPFYALGILFRNQGKNKPAAKCFERVLIMSKGHSKAVDAMRELARKKKDKGSLLNLFKKK